MFIVNFSCELTPKNNRLRTSKSQKRIKLKNPQPQTNNLLVLIKKRNFRYGFEKLVSVQNIRQIKCHWCIYHPIKSMMEASGKNIQRFLAIFGIKLYHRCLLGT